MTIDQWLDEHPELKALTWDQVKAKFREVMAGKVTGCPQVVTHQRALGYREDLARFPGDPQAHCDTQRGVQKLIDQRLREGWRLGPPLAEIDDSAKRNKRTTNVNAKGARALVDEAYNEARREVNGG